MRIYVVFVFVAYAACVREPGSAINPNSMFLRAH